MNVHVNSTRCYGAAVSFNTRELISTAVRDRASRVSCCSRVALRAADYTALKKQLGDQGNTEDETDDVRAGRMFILSSKYVGGD